MNWYIRNKINSQLINKSGFYTNIKESAEQNNDISIYIDGHIIPRIEYYPYYRDHSPLELVRVLFLKYGNYFVNYIKGAFTIIIFLNDTFLIFSDRHSIKKYFLYKNDKEFCISNSLKYISEQYALNLNYKSAAIFTLFSHFFNGETLFQEVESTKPGQIISFNDGNIDLTYYWQPQNIIKNRKVKNKSVKYFAEKWQNIISNYIEYFNPSGISVTLTGGNDSRMVLAALLSLKKDIHAFSFGNPDSFDGVIANKISRHVNLHYTNHFVKKPTSDWLEKHAKSLTLSGNSLINIHRAHRNDAAECEKRMFSDSDMIFTGLMGGEYLKEPKYDDIVIPNLFERLPFLSKKDAISLLEDQLESRGFNSELININEVYDEILAFINKASRFSVLEKKFLYAYYYGCAHHTQDSNVFGHHFKYIVSPFMDIDFLEMISEYNKWYLNKKVNNNRLFHSILFVAITDFLSHELSVIPYAKRGKYTADDLLRKKIKYMVKRFSFLITNDSTKYPQTFPMGNWLYDFSEKNLSQFSEEISDIFNLDVLRKHLEVIKNVTTEEPWHIVTNPINLNMIHKHYGKT